MRNCRLTFVFGLVAPIALGWAGCFIATEGETYDDTAGTTGSNNSNCSFDEIGTEGCPCTMGDVCNMPLLCNTNIDRCISDLCPLGDEACPCTSEGSCNPDLQCLSGFCVDNSCPTGMEGCNCTPGGGCDQNLVCLSDLCVNPSGLETGDSDASADTVAPESSSGLTTDATTEGESSTGNPDPDTTGGSGTGATTGG